MSNYILIKVDNLTQDVINNASKKKVLINLESFLSTDTLDKFRKNKIEIHDPMYVRISSMVKHYEAEAAPKIEDLFENLNMGAAAYPTDFPELGIQPDSEFQIKYEREARGIIQSNISHHISRVQSTIGRLEFEEKGFLPDFSNVVDMSDPSLISEAPEWQWVKAIDIDGDLDIPKTPEKV